MLHGRAAELAEIYGLLTDARGGRSSLLVLQGEAGSGKTALLEHVAGDAEDFRVLRCTGVESEAELPFAALHLLLLDFLDRLDSLPRPQAAALRAAFGLEDAPGVDRFLAGLATLTLLSEVAETGRCYAWSTTHSGWTGNRSTPCCSPGGGSAPRASAARLRLVMTEVVDRLPECNSSHLAGSAIRRLPPCLPNARRGWPPNRARPRHRGGHRQSAGADRTGRGDARDADAFRRRDTNRGRRCHRPAVGCSRRSAHRSTGCPPRPAAAAGGGRRGRRRSRRDLRRGAPAWAWLGRLRGRRTGRAGPGCPTTRRVPPPTDSLCGLPPLDDCRTQRRPPRTRRRLVATRERRPAAPGISPPRRSATTTAAATRWRPRRPGRSSRRLRRERGRTRARRQAHREPG